VFTLASSVRMALAGTSGQTADRGSLGSTVSAGVLGFLTPFIDSVLSPAWATGMSLARTCSQAGDTTTLGSTVFAVIIGHGGQVVFTGSSAVAFCFSARACHEVVNDNMPRPSFETGQQMSPKVIPDVFLAVSATFEAFHQDILHLLIMFFYALGVPFRICHHQILLDAIHRVTRIVFLLCLWHIVAEA